MKPEPRLSERLASRGLLAHLGEEGREILDLQDLYAECVRDFSLAEKHLAETDDRYSRRQLVRTFHAYVETIVTNLKRQALHEAARFDNAERALLAEEKYELTDTGEPKVVLQMISLARNVRFAFRCYAKAHGISFYLSVDGPGWRDFRSALRVRNRLTHPRTAADLDLSDAEIETIARAHRWLTTQYSQIVRLALEKVLYDSGWTTDDVANFNAEVEKEVGYSPLGDDFPSGASH